MRRTRMKLLVACEESQRVCTAFREKGHQAYSCDLQACSGGHPEWHIMGDALEALKGGTVVTADGVMHDIGSWDMLIAHPPCTYLSAVTTRHLSLRVTPPDKVVSRMWDLAGAAVFFMCFALADIPKIAVENPRGYMSRLWRKPDQMIHPFFFAESEESESYEKKGTCLWLKGLPPLQRTSYLPEPKPKYISPHTGKAYYFEECVTSTKNRSKTFSAVARAMAEQWG